MNIRELTIRNFGKFTDTHIEFSEGINLVYGENESGKSTLHGFIKGMLFGMNRARGRAALNDPFCLYEPWDNPNYYSGILKFESGGKQFCIDRNFDKYSKKSSLFCEDDGEELSVEDGDLSVILGGLSPSLYEDTISIGQLAAKPGQSLATELKNYATSCCAAGNTEINLSEALNLLQGNQKQIDKNIKGELDKKQRKREKIELEASYVWRDVHALLEEQEDISEHILQQIEEKKQKEKNEQKEQENKTVIEEIRAGKWRIHPLEIFAFVVSIIIAFIVISKPWNYLVSIIIFLICGIYVWNRMKVGKKEENTESEKILEGLLRQKEQIPLEQLYWEKSRVDGELREKQIYYDNLQEQLEELEELSDVFKENDRRKSALQVAAQKLEELSLEMQEGQEKALNKRVSAIIDDITDGKYTRLIIENNMQMSLISGDRKIAVERVSRGTIEQTYFALRMAVSELLHEEEYPVILDDTFVFYDDIRLGRTLKWLSQNRRQVIVFTCQKREEQSLKELGIPFCLIQ